jgi:large subunit ribosomal protein L35
MKKGGHCGSGILFQRGRDCNVDHFSSFRSTIITTPMSACQKAARPLHRCLQQTHSSIRSSNSIRTFTTTRQCRDVAATVETSASPTTKYNPLTVSSPRGERALLRSGINPIGSRRRRAALKSADNLPFEQLPYQCFQEARKVLQADREEKLQAIAKERERIARLNAQDAATIPGGERQKQIRLDSMSRYLERLKILADINDPLIKKRFEDGEGM